MSKKKWTIGEKAMRRADREITDQDQIEAFIRREQILRIAFYDEGDIYIVPVNYGCLRADDQYSFYFHGARVGRKYELAKKNPLVGFEIDGGYRLLENETACEFSAAFQSVTGTGRLYLVEDDEKKKGLDAIMKQATKQPEWDYSEEMLRVVAVFRLDVEKISCKRK